MKAELPTWAGVAAAVLIPLLAAIASWAAAGARFETEIEHNAADIAKIDAKLSEMDQRQREIEKSTAQILGLLKGMTP